MRKIRPKKKFIAIGKIGNNPDGSATCIKHWIYNDIDKYLEKVAPKFDFRWINFYYNTGSMKGTQFKSWTKSKGLFDPVITKNK